MVILTIVVLVLHVLAAVLWLGPTLGLTKMVERAIPVGKDALGLAVIDFKFRGMLASVGGMSVLATGLALIFLAGGFKVVPLPTHIAFGLGILAALNSAVYGPGTKKLALAAERYDDATIAEAKAALRKMAMHSHISHLLWLAMLVMMFWARIAPRG